MSKYKCLAFLIKKYFMFYVYGYFATFMSMNHVHVCYSQNSEKEIQHSPLKLELQIVMRYYVGAGRSTSFFQPTE